MQLPLLDVLDSPLTLERVVPVWNTLDDEHRTMVVAAVARLIVKLAATQRVATAAADQETDHA